MKIGDKLYCNTNFYDRYGNLRFEKGKYYIIVYIRNYMIIELRCNKGFSHGFSSSCDTIGGCKPLNFYFNNKKEERKLKLKKLNGN